MFPGGAAVNTGLLIVIIVVVVIVALLAVVIARRRRSEGLQTRFGSEYPRTVARAGDRRAAESQLAEREQRHHQLRTRAGRPSALSGGVAGGPGQVRRRPRHGHPRG